MYSSIKIVYAEIGVSFGLVNETKAVSLAPHWVRSLSAITVYCIRFHR